MKGVSNDIDLLNPPPELEQKKHKLKRLVPSPNSFFMVRGFVHLCMCLHFSQCYVFWRLVFFLAFHIKH
jgi:small subunit ribosomal protein S27e